MNLAAHPTSTELSSWSWTEPGVQVRSPKLKAEAALIKRLWSPCPPQPSHNCFTLHNCIIAIITIVIAWLMTLIAWCILNALAMLFFGQPKLSLKRPKWPDPLYCITKGRTTQTNQRMNSASPTLVSQGIWFTALVAHWFFIGHRSAAAPVPFCASLPCWSFTCGLGTKWCKANQGKTRSTR